MNNQLWTPYHAIREAYAARIWKVGFVKVTHNIYNILTRIISGTANDKDVKKWMWRKYTWQGGVELSKLDPLRVADLRGVQYIRLVV